MVIKEEMALNIYWEITLAELKVLLHSHFTDKILLESALVHLLNILSCESLLR